MEPKGISQYNRQAWDALVVQGNRWTVPASSEVIAAARAGEWSVLLTPQTPVPRSWFPSFAGLDVLALASGGGQQAPIFAVLGANVTVLDNSQKQLDQDQAVARREELQIRAELGDMRDLSRFSSASFDLVFNPCSLSFVPHVQPVFDEASRVLRPGGVFMGGFINPIRFVFDESSLNDGTFRIRHSLPYADITHLTESEQKALQQESEPFMFSHSLADLIGGQARAGFDVRELFEDTWDDDALSRFFPPYFATKAVKSAVVRGD